MTSAPVSVRAARETDASCIADIYNQGIADRGATFETTPRTPSEISGWLREAPRYPTLVAESNGHVLGWARLGAYRPRACYAGIAEFSIYLERAARGRGVGRVLLAALIAHARDLGYWKLVARIFPFNTASRRLCRTCGFREVGTYEKHAQLDGRWLDVTIVERLLDPATTSDGAGCDRAG